MRARGLTSACSRRRVFQRKVIAFVRPDEPSIGRGLLARRLVTPQLMRRAVSPPAARILDFRSGRKHIVITSNQEQP